MNAKQTSKLVALLSIAALLVSSAGADLERNSRWDYLEMPQKQIDFFDEHIPPIADLHETEGNKAALEALDKVWTLAKEELGTFYLRRAVWFEAQAYSGKQDQEWGLALYEYLFDKEITSNPTRPSTPFLRPAEYIMCGNIMASCLGVGKVAHAREYSLMIEKSLKEDLHFDLTGESYTDKGPIFPFLDEARNREYPIFEHDMIPDENDNETLGFFGYPITNVTRTLNSETGVERFTTNVVINCGDKREDSPTRDFFYYPTMYGIGDVAGTAMRAGDWKKAAELSAWTIRYANEYLVDQELMKEEVNLNCAYEAYTRLSNISLLHGYTDEAIHFLEKYIELSEGYYQTERWDLLRAKLDLAVLQIKTGELPDDVLTMADEAAQEMANNWYYSRMENMRGYLNKARVLHALGQPEEAWKIVNDLMAKVENDANPQYWLTMLDTAIDLAIDDGAVHPELEDWLKLALENARLTGNKFNELPLYEKYARFLCLKGRYVEALQIQQEAVRLAKSMQLPKRQADNAEQLAAINNITPNTDDAPDRPEDQPQNVIAEQSTSEGEQPEERAQTVVDHGVITSAHPPQKPVVGVDIQPQLSVSISLPEQAAFGRFYVFNPAAVVQKGTLRLTGPIDQVEWQNNRMLSVSSSTIFKEKEWSAPLQLASGSACIVDIIGLPNEDGSGGQVQCEWIPSGAGESVISGTWSFGAAATEKRTAVIDAHELQDNPFYLIPIHHMIQRLDIDEAQTIDFSVKASSPMRIESYDAYTGTLLAVDANGDGDFLDKGDMVSGDANNNNWPDLVFEKQQRLSSLAMYVHPHESSTEDIELTIQIQTEEGWQTDSIDVIKPFVETE